MSSFIRSGSSPFAQEANRRQQQVFRNRIARWVQDVTQSDDRGLPLSTFESGEGDGYRFFIDEPSGERFVVHVRANGSIQTEMTLNWVDSTALVDYGSVIDEMAELISNFYHDDVIQFSHAVYPDEGGFLLRSIASIDSTPDLMTLVAEALLLLDLLVDRLVPPLPDGGVST